MSQLHIFGHQTNVGSQADGNSLGARGTRDGILFTANWQQALLLEGRLHQMTVGTVTAGGDVSPITGGGAGTTIDQDQPEFGVSVPNGTALIPISIIVSCNADLDADAEVADIIVTADVDAAYAGDGTVTTETPVNLISDGGVTSVATAFSAATADITDPTVSMILDSDTITLAQYAADATGASAYNLRLSYQPIAPVILKGPAAFYGYWGGTAAVTGVASVIWAEVPEARYTV